MKKIKLTKGHFAIVDDSDFDFLNQWKWYSHNGYGRRDAVIEGKKRIIHLHRLLCDGEEIDHINGNPSDNRRQNLRAVTHKQNLQNQRPQTGKSSKYKGVSWNKTNKNWNAYIKNNRVKISLGVFKKEKDAARAYDKKAKELFGEFARLNLCS